ncbi:hypothetical protein Q3G72_028012 [Acer saccharum]|nr:hypothetical protein Q3G72_028012 [Acer saccharum]
MEVYAHGDDEVKKSKGHEAHSCFELRIHQSTITIIGINKNIVAAALLRFAQVTAVNIAAVLAHSLSIEHYKYPWNSNR